jgi:AcrR family transcriptional regulator
MTEEETKTAILDAALAEFSTNGMSGARIETIAKKIGLSYGAVYYHYSSKEVLFHMTVQRSIEESLALFDQMTPGSSSYEQLADYTHIFLEWAGTKHGAQSLLLFYQALTADCTPDITRIYLKEKTGIIYARIQEIMTGITELGLAKERTPQELSSMYNALMIGYAFLRISKLDTALPADDLFLSFLK